ncbi:hypothetical protein [Novipirellula artificiosorum]|uniref:hypothetical protein n=1 Tax=Novipirellula artificiosorum TaxID=2528016 RepID=UPI001E6119B5|nr:hypothetical protein [Novipirellula artificiosorum]
MAVFNASRSTDLPKTWAAAQPSATVWVCPTPCSIKFSVAACVYFAAAIVATSVAFGDDAFERRSSWQRYDVAQMSQMLRSSLDEIGVLPLAMDQASEQFIAAIEKRDMDPLDAYVASVRRIVPSVDALVISTEMSLAQAGASIDPNAPTYGEIESLSKTLRMTLRTWLGRELVRSRLYDEALPVIAEVDATESIDPAAVLFYRGACYHALLMKTEALADLRRLLENEDESPIRFTRTAQMMIADIKPLKEDSLDEISRIMTDVSRRLDLGRTDEEVEKREQQIIDKLTKLIDKIEQQQQQQQQNQSAGGQNGQGQQQGTPMEDSRIAGANGNGDVDPKQRKDGEGWGNLPPAQRQEALQQISRDLPTHYREAIEAYFRKLATEGK